MKLATAAVLATVCAGCLYSEPLVPGAAEPVDHRVLGPWRCVAPDSAEPSILTVTQAPDRRYRAEFSGGEDKPAVFVAYAVRFEGKLLLNAQLIEDGDPGKWTLVRYTLYRPNVLHIEFARDEPFREATTSGQRMGVLKRELRGAQLFEDYCTCIRVKER